MTKLRSENPSEFPYTQPISKLVAFGASFVCATSLHLGPIALMYRVDPHFHIEPIGRLILASICLIHTAVLNLPGRIGAWIGCSSLIVGSLFTLLNLIHIQLFKGPLSFMALASTVHSNFQEATEFFDSYGGTIWMTTGVFLACCIASGWGYLVTRPIRNWVLVKMPFYLGLALMIPLILRSWDNPKQTLWVIHEYAYIDRFLACALRYKQVLEGKAHAQTFLEKRDAIKTNLHLNRDSGHLAVPLVIVVIGESTSRGHMGVYGYKHQTTPMMHALRDRLVFFSDTISPVANTIPAVLGALCAESFDPKTWHCASPNLMELATSAGYKTSWISNQSATGFGENMISILGQSADSHIFVNRQVATGGETAEHISLDEKILPAVRERLRDFAQNGRPQMLFVHLMGTHFTYEKRYPRTASHDFRPSNWPTDRTKDPAARAIIHHYDNAISYQDMVLGNILKDLYTLPKNALFFYFSDHGEEVFDTDSFYGHNEDRLTPAMREIPFIVGFSKGLESSHPDLVKKLQDARDRPFTLTKLTLSIADMLGIGYPGMPRRESVFSTNFIPAPRMTFSGPYERISQ